MYGQTKFSIRFCTVAAPLIILFVTFTDLQYGTAAGQSTRSDYGVRPAPRSQQSTVPKSIYLTPKGDRLRSSKGDRTDRTPQTTPRQSLSDRPTAPRNTAPSNSGSVLPAQATNPVPRTSQPAADRNRKIGLAMHQGRLVLTRYHTMRVDMPHRECRKFPEFMITGYGLPKRTVHTLADNMMIVQKRLCAGNGSVVVTCYQNRATISLRQAKPGDGCRS